MNFSEFMEEWRPFPKDKVNRSIEKKEKSGNGDDALRAHTQKAVKNYRTKMTDTSKAQQKFTGSDAEKQNKQMYNHNSERNKAIKKMDKLNDKWAGKKGDKAIKKPESKSGKKFQKDGKKFDNQLNKAQTSTKRRDGMSAVHRTDNRNTISDDKKQAEHNKKDKEARATAKRMMNRAGLESAYKKSPSKPTSKNESMNFTEFCNAFVAPLFEADGIPQCPPGYKFDKKNLMCVPKTSKDDVRGNRKDKKDMEPGNMPSFNSIGSHGQNGAPYAYEEPGDGGGE